MAALFTKNQVLEALETITVPGEGQNMVESGAVKNVQVFGDEVVVDITIKNPSLQARKKTEVEILKTIHEKVYQKAKITVNIKVDAPAHPKVNEILDSRGNPTVEVEVGLLDADIYGPSMPIMFDVAHAKPLATEVDGKSKMVPVENYGVQLLSIGFFTQPNQAVIWRGPMAAKALNQMIFDAHWGELDFLLIDLPPGTGYPFEHHAITTRNGSGCGKYTSGGSPGRCA